MSDRPATERRGSVEENELAWGIIANVSGGDWLLQSPEWQDAAHRWGVRNGWRVENADARRADRKAEG